MGAPCWKPRRSPAGVRRPFSLTGDVSERKMVMAIGETGAKQGNNGKSTWIDAISHTMHGDYAMSIPVTDLAGGRFRQVRR